jgi:NAD(P)-dependent dehydrogenase (short-subunit alcohol dehydrogenase family)
MTIAMQGQVALVTGASRGIGRAIAQALAQQGVVVVGSATTEAGAQAVSDALGAHGGRGIVLNVNDAAALEAAVDAIVKQHGALHILVNNAGITRDTLAMRMKDEDWDAVLDTNLKAVFRASRAVMRTMMKQRYGRIVNITSVVGASGNPGQANYAAAKAGVAGMTRQLRGARLHRHRHDRQPGRRAEDRAAGADSARPARQRRGGGRGRRVPRVARRRLRDGHRNARQRRHADDLIPPE